MGNSGQPSPYDDVLYIGEREISLKAPVYFVADIAANHDGDLERAIDLIWKAADAGADAVKFQHFLAKEIVSDFGFKSLKGQLSHQSNWKKPVYEIYEQYEVNRDWNDELIAAAGKAGIDFFTTPYDFSAVEDLKEVLIACKIGSGDVTWHEFIRTVAKLNKPLMIATGAADMAEVEGAVEAVLSHNRQIVLMQCNTNYTGSLENFKYINLNVLKTYARRWPGMILGLSDHTPGFSTTLGAVTLGARVIEKHFTDDVSRTGPDHAFSMSPVGWRDMVDNTRELEAALGNGIKRVEENEKDTVVVQRRAMRFKDDVSSGTKIDASNLEVLRPAPEGIVPPYELENVVGMTLNVDKPKGDALFWSDLEKPC